MAPPCERASLMPARALVIQLAAGAAAALVGMISFGVFHTLWIRNIPAVFVEGLLYVVPAALGLAWMIRVTGVGRDDGPAPSGSGAPDLHDRSGRAGRSGRRDGGPASGRRLSGQVLRRGARLGLLLWLTLVPYELVGLLWGPWEQPASFRAALPILWLAFLGVPVGAGWGWWLTGRAAGAAAWAVAALTVDFTLGGGIAFEGGWGRFLGLFLWLLPTHVLAGVVLVGIPRRRLTP